ncbi:unnamed protein product [Prunus armeniaca]|uniref:Fringe-like glycosyltransferase domain-containing protein n=1 Tax=Prunus armeniaca TaxID=36596 RepID=A0A6J5VAY8_PRUAR|nr:unnamed protein product [Prunus armeniaca]
MEGPPTIHQAMVEAQHHPRVRLAGPKTLPQHDVARHGPTLQSLRRHVTVQTLLRVRFAVRGSYSENRKRELVRWFVIGDDDTVFCTHNLVTVLAKYDHNQMYYIGGTSESVDQVVIHLYSMAYGGGGFAVSYPLAAELVKILDWVHRSVGSIIRLRLKNPGLFVWVRLECP